MVTKIVKWGNSLGLRIPKAFAKELGIEPDRAVDIRVENDCLVVRPRPRPTYTLDEMVSKVTTDNRHDEVDPGSPIGREPW